jgi:hypothetical protein
MLHKHNAASLDNSWKANHNLALQIEMTGCLATVGEGSEHQPPVHKMEH